MLTTLSITVLKPDKLLNMNDRGHWSERAGSVSVWRDAAFWWAKQHRIRCHAAPDATVEIWVAFGTDKPNQRRDPHNFFPTVKAICDGFTDAAVWPDDDSKHVHTVEPTFTTDIAASSLTITLTWEAKE